MKITNLIDPDSQGEDAQKEQFAIDVLTGLAATPKSLSSKYFYDDAGSEIFKRITQHHDYYPTRTEVEIIREMNAVLPRIIDEKEIDIIELGTGDGHKSQLIIQGFLDVGHIVNFYPIDISGKAMDMLESNIDKHENLNIHGVVAEYFKGLRLVREKSANRQLVLFPGSNIGNFDSLWKGVKESTLT